MSKRVPIEHVDFEIASTARGVDEFLNFYPEVCQLFEDTAKHAEYLRELVSLKEKLEYIKRIGESFVMIFYGDSLLQRYFLKAKSYEVSNETLNSVIDAYLDESNWRDVDID